MRQSHTFRNFRKRRCTKLLWLIAVGVLIQLVRISNLTKKPGPVIFQAQNTQKDVPPLIAKMMLNIGFPQLQGLQYIDQPSVPLASNRTAVRLVIGIPTVKRSPETYLINTLTSLIEDMQPFERNWTLIVIMIGEPNDWEFVRNVTSSIQAGFPLEVQEGLLEIVVPAAQFYTNFTAYTSNRTLYNDRPARLKWRVKQNLDYAYLMLYCKPRGEYYLQLEDDVMATNGYVSTILADVQDEMKSLCVSYEFTTLGFIGKLFRSSDLAQLAAFILLFCQDKPVDFILFDYLNVIQTVDKKACIFKESLFTHIGKFSTLQRKTHKILERNKLHTMNKLRHKYTSMTHVNPKAKVTTSLTTHENYHIHTAYTGDSMFRALPPHPGDYIQFEFEPPASVTSFLFISGDADHSGDVIRNAIVEACFERTPPTHYLQNLVKTQSGCWFMATFTNDGVCSGSISEMYGPVKSLVIRFQTPLPNWILLNEIILKTPEEPSHKNITL